MLFDYIEGRFRFPIVLVVMSRAPGRGGTIWHLFFSSRLLAGWILRFSLHFLSRYDRIGGQLRNIYWRFTFAMSSSFVLLSCSTSRYVHRYLSDVVWLAVGMFTFREHLLSGSVHIGDVLLLLAYVEIVLFLNLRTGFVSVNMCRSSWCTLCVVLIVVI